MVFMVVACVLAYWLQVKEVGFRIQRLTVKSPVASICHIFEQDTFCIASVDSAE